MTYTSNTAEAHFERLDDQGQLNAYEAREASGYVTELTDFGAAAIESRLGQTASDTRNHKNGFDNGNLANAIQENPQVAATYLAGVALGREEMHKHCNAS